MKGKNRCRILKDIRRRIAEENGIEYVTSECKYKGDCRGTCPKCEAEVRYLEQALEQRRSLGYKVTVAGLVAGLALSPVGCTPDEKTNSDITSQNSAVVSFVSENESSAVISPADETSVSSFVSSEDIETMGEEPESAESNGVISDDLVFSEETELILMGDMIPEEEEVEPDIMLESSFGEETELMGEPVDYE